MQKSEPIALVDMDGTIVDYDGAMTRDLAKLRAPDEQPFEDRGGPSGENPPHIEERVRLIRHQPGWWRNLEPLPAGMALLRTLEAIGFQVNILTKGPSSTHSAWTEKVEWCARHIPGIPVTVTADKGLVYGKVLVDDWPPYIQRWQKWRPRGLVIMPAHRWNADFQHPNVVRYSGDPEELSLIRLKLQAIVERISMERLATSA